MSFVSIAPLIEGSQQRIENAVVCLENLIEEHNVRLRDFPRRLYRRLAGMERSESGAISVELFRVLSEKLKRAVHITVSVELTNLRIQISLQILVYRIVRQRGLRHRAGDQTGQVDTPEKLFFIGLLGHLPLKLPHTPDPLPKEVDGMTLGLAGFAEDEEIAAGQKRDSDALDQLLPLRKLSVDLCHDSQHLVS